MKDKNPQNNQLENNQRKHKLVGVFMALVLPALVIVITIVMLDRNVDLGTVLKESVLGNSKESTANQSDLSETPSVFAKELQPIYSEASRLKIPAVGIDIAVHRVGVNDDGTMETPDNWQEGGWYINSGHPGEKRNVVINAHYDNNYGGPAAFYNLKKIEQGDKVEVVDDYGRIFNYNVVELSYLDIQDPSRLDILKDEEDKSTLTLITCGGVWLPGSGYNKRLVVKADLSTPTQTASTNDKVDSI